MNAADAVQLTKQARDKAQQKFMEGQHEYQKQLAARTAKQKKLHWEPIVQDLENRVSRIARAGQSSFGLGDVLYLNGDDQLLIPELVKEFIRRGFSVEEYQYGGIRLGWDV